MPERVKIDPVQGIVEVVAYDEVTLHQMIESRELILKNLEEYSLTGFLYDGRKVTQAPKGAALFEFVKLALSNSRVRGMRFAVITNEKSAMPHSFLTATARRLGYLARVFHDRQAALAWLCDGHKVYGDSPVDGATIP